MQTSILLLVAVLSYTCAQSSSLPSSITFSTISGTIPVTLTGSYASLASTQVSLSAATGTASGNATTTSAGSTSTVTLLQGGGVGLETLTVINGTSTIFPNSTAAATRSSTSTSASATVTNTQPCNGWAEFCSRKYSNITQVAAHNAAFVVKSNAASNQEYGLTQQLDDGIRMLTGETQWVNNTFYSCHTSCDLLNAGTLLSNLQQVATWVEAHPYDVVTLLLVNSNYRPVTDYVPVIQNSGLSRYLYTPPLIPMHNSDWPTLSQMILRQERVVIFVDYQANQTEVPYIIDEFSSIWETPFSPQDVNFPCTIQRPPTLTNTTIATTDYMYLANHNLNQAISLAGASFLIPNTAVINNTNAAGNETGQLGRMANTCYAMWNKPPNWLLVDYYDRVNGSVFEVAAAWNNVTYDRKCCGVATSRAARTALSANWANLVAAAIVAGIALLA